MGIKTRIETAKFLIANNRHSDALILILLAIAASSRKLYPKSQGLTDREAFTQFLGQGIDYKIPFSLPYRKNKNIINPLVEVIYEHYRCSLIHEGELANNVSFTAKMNIESSVRNHLSVRVDEHSAAEVMVMTDNSLVMNYNWLTILIKSVEEADINIDMFGPRPLIETINNGEESATFVSVQSFTDEDGSLL